MHGFAALDPRPMPRNSSEVQKLRNQKLISEIRRILDMSFEEPKKPVRTKGAGELSRLAQQPRSGHGLDWSEATQRSVVGVQVLSRRRRLHPCHVANVGWGQSPTVLARPLRVAQ